jgi:RNA polymerase sigma factor (sigma-70 family)
VADDDATDARFEAAYRTGWPAVFRFALAWTNSQDDALEAAQETFFRLWIRRDRVDFGRDIVPLALTIERRLLTDKWRTLRRRMRSPHHVVSLEPTWTPAVADDWLDVQAAFARLTPTERVAITAISISGRSYAEVAEAMGVTEGALRAAASRGRHKLGQA